MPGWFPKPHSHALSGKYRLFGDAGILKHIVRNVQTTVFGHRYRHNLFVVPRQHFAMDRIIHVQLLLQSFYLCEPGSMRIKVQTGVVNVFFDNKQRLERISHLLFERGWEDDTPFTVNGCTVFVRKRDHLYLTYRIEGKDINYYTS